MAFIRAESEHYNFYVKEASLAEREIAEIIEVQECAYRAISDLLDLKEAFKISYYLFDTAEEVGNVYGELYGDFEPCNGFASAPDKIYAVYNERIKCIGPHEDAHILSYKVNKPCSVFIREGLAMFFDESWWGRANKLWVKDFLQNGSYVSLGCLLNDEHFYEFPDALSYPTAGAFTEFLIQSFGKDKYLAFYRYQGTDFAAELLRIYEHSLSDLEAQFKEHVMDACSEADS